jgi:Flp pilus assembly protein TadD
VPASDPAALRPWLLAQQAFWTALLVVPLVFSTQSFEAFYSIKSALAASLLWLGALLFGLHCLDDRSRVPRSPLAYSLLALAGLFLVSNAAAHRLAEGAFSFVTLVPFALGLVLCSAAAAERTFRQGSVRLLLAASGVGAAYGILQYLDLDVLERLFELWVRTEGKRGIFSTVGNPNFLAELLVLAFPFALAAHATAAKRAHRAVLLRLLVLLCVAILACGTRGVWLGLLLSTALLLGLAAGLCPRHRGALARSVVTLALAGTLGAARFLTLGARRDAEGFGERARVLTGDIGVSGRARMLAWRIALEDMVPRSAPYEALLSLGRYRLPPEAGGADASPWLGSGLGSFYLDFMSARGRHFDRLGSAEHRTMLGALNYDRLHNDYLQVLVEGGLLGAALVLMTLLALPVVFWRRVRGEDEPRRLARIAALCAFVGPAVHGLFSFPAHLASTGLGLVFAFGAVVAGPEPAAAPAARRRPWALALVALLAVGGISQILRPFLADIVRKGAESSESGRPLELNAGNVAAGLRLEPLNGPLRFALAKAAYQDRDYATAERETRAALRGANDIALHALLGLACLSQGRGEEALGHLAVAASMSAGEPAVVYYQALAAAASGKAELAAERLQRLLERNVRHVEAWMLLGDLRARGGDFAGALECFLEATALQPEGAEGWLRLAMVQAQLGRVEAALAALERSLSLRPDDARAQGLRRALLSGPR